MSQNIVRKSVTHKIPSKNTHLLNDVFSLYDERETSENFKIELYKFNGSKVQEKIVKLIDDYETNESKINKYDNKTLLKKYKITPKSEDYDIDKLVAAIKTRTPLEFVDEYESYEKVRSYTDDNELVRKLISNYLTSIGYQNAENIVKNIFDVNCEAFRRYSEIVLNNIHTSRNDDVKTEVHHILPFGIQESINALVGFLNEDNVDLFSDNGNLVRLETPQHRLAHFYLSQSLNFEYLDNLAKESESNYSNVYQLYTAIFKALVICSPNIDEERKMHAKNPSYHPFGLDKIQVPDMLKESSNIRNAKNMSELSFLKCYLHNAASYQRKITDNNNKHYTVGEFIDYISMLYNRENNNKSPREKILFELTLKQVLQFSKDSFQYPFPENSKYAKLNVNIPKEKTFSINGMKKERTFSKNKNIYQIYSLENQDYVKNYIGEDLQTHNIVAVEQLYDKPHSVVHHHMAVMSAQSCESAYILESDYNEHFYIERCGGSDDDKEFNSVIKEKNKYNEILYRELKKWENNDNIAQLSNDEKHFAYILQKQKIKQDIVNRYQLTQSDGELFPDTLSKNRYIFDMEDNIEALFHHQITYEDFIKNPLTNTALSISGQADLQFISPSYMVGNKNNIQKITLYSQNNDKQIHQCILSTSPQTLTQSLFDNVIKEKIRKERNILIIPERHLPQNIIDKIEQQNSISYHEYAKKHMHLPKTWEEYKQSMSRTQTITIIR